MNPITSPHDFYGKKILILGLGLHGGGVAAAYWFFRQGAEVIVSDIKSRAELEPSLVRLTTLCNEYRLAHPGKHCASIEYILGRHRDEDILRADCIIQNAGVPRDSPFLSLARAHAVPIHNDASIFFALAQRVNTIGVTGTRGKTTTVSLLGVLLKQTFPRVVVGGIATSSGAISFFSILDRVLEDRQNGCTDPVVLELSSWQLEVLGAHAVSPQYAVMTTIKPDHLNRYASMDAYIEAKKNIFRFQPTDDKGGVVLNIDDPIHRLLSAGIASERLYWYSRTGATIERGCSIERSRASHTQTAVWHDGVSRLAVYDMSNLSLQGLHNQDNALAALTTGMMVGADVPAMDRALSSWTGMPGRLECIGIREGRIWYNDTTATSPDATIAALTTLGKRSKKIILIAGGADKNLHFDELGCAIGKRVKALIMLSGTASPHIVSACAACGYSASIDYANSMADAVNKAWKRSQKGDILLLSPAAASFGLFQHEFDRGNQFLEAVQALQANRGV
ncbi:UDP-N-acetylmuramoyl-L-alanine--D-glutamate ligase [Candidatus Uhrbacteria bacterium]|nr:UDP-N-acetylmuramoyl-L-alanine--D-glutamate ligase [Candidatus Uhrbacteria bacterium]